MLNKDLLLKLSQIGPARSPDLANSITVSAKQSLENRERRFRKIKHEGSLKERRETLNTPDGFDYICKNLTGRKIGKIFFQCPDLLFSTLEREIEWIVQIFIQNSALINKFATACSEFDSDLSQGKIEKARQSLNNIIKAHGWSLAIIQRFIALCWQTKDESGLLHFIEEIINGDDDDIIKFITCAFYFNANPLIATEYFNKLLEKNLLRVNADTATTVFLRLCLQKKDHPFFREHDRLAFSIYNMGPLSLYDQYEYFIILTQGAFLHSTTHTTPAIANIAGFPALSRSVTDERLDWLTGNGFPQSESFHTIASGIHIESNNTETNHRVIELSLQFKLLCENSLDADAAYSHFDSWISRQTSHPYVMCAQVFIDTLRGNRPKDTLARWIGRFDSKFQIALKKQHIISTISSSIELIKYAIQNGDLLTAYCHTESLVSHIEKSESPQQAAELISEIARNAPLFSPLVKSNNKIQCLISNHHFRSLDDVFILISFFYITDSLMEASIRVEELLDATSLQKPSELIPLLNISGETLFDFAYRCCSLELLEQLPSVGPGESEIIKERLAILHIASAKCTQNQVDIKAEISAIIKFEKLRSLETIVEESRLRVNTLALGEKIKLIYKASPSTYFIDPENRFHFHVTLMGLFLLDEEHGLDAELSGRIRHGKLRERLLNPFLSNNLINADGVDSSLEFLLPSLSLISPSALQSARILFSELNEEVTKLIDSFVDNKAQLRFTEVSWKGFPGLLSSNTSPEGLICVTKLKERSLQILEESLHTETLTHALDIEFLYPKSISALWIALNEQLTTIRSYILNIIQTSLRQKIDDCSRSLQNLELEYKRDNFTHCRSQLANVCAEVSRWFSIPAKIDFPESKFGDILELAIKAVELCGIIKTQVHISDKIRTKILQPEEVGHAYDLAVLIISNCTKHGLPDENGILSIIIEDESDWISISNRPRGNLNEDITEANRLISEFRDQGINSAVNREGKSGYPKIIRLLRKLTKTIDPPIEVSAQNDFFKIKIKITR